MHVCMVHGLAGKCREGLRKGEELSGGGSTELEKRKGDICNIFHYKDFLKAINNGRRYICLPFSDS